MTFRRNRMNNVLVLGMFFLVAANLWNWALRKYAFLPENPADLIGGFLMGVAIATMILGLWRQRTLGRRDGCARQ